MAEKIRVKEKQYSAVKEGKYWKFYCDCGAEMWNNSYKKSKGDLSAKAPDLRCKDDNCSCGSENKKGDYNPNSVWFEDKEMEAFGMKKKNFSSKQDVVTKKEKYVKAPVEVKATNQEYEELSNIPVSMYAAWAKDVALYLAKATDIKAHDDFDALYRTCLENMKSTLTWFENKKEAVSKAETKEVTSSASFDNEEIEIEDSDEAEEVKDVDDEFEDLDFEL